MDTHDTGHPQFKGSLYPYKLGPDNNRHVESINHIIQVSKIIDPKWVKEKNILIPANYSTEEICKIDVSKGIDDYCENLLKNCNHFKYPKFVEIDIDKLKECIKNLHCDISLFIDAGIVHYGFDIDTSKIKSSTPKELYRICVTEHKKITGQQIYEETQTGLPGFEPSSKDKTQPGKFSRCYFPEPKKIQ